MSPSDDAALLRDLLGRLAGGLPLLIGEAPSNLPLSLQLPAGARLLGSRFWRPSVEPGVDWRTIGPGAEATVFLDILGDFDSMVAYLHDLCRRAGWRPPVRGGRLEPTPPVFFSSAGPDDWYLDADLWPPAGGRCRVDLRFGRRLPRPPKPPDPVRRVVGVLNPMRVFTGKERVRATDSRRRPDEGHILALVEGSGRVEQVEAQVVARCERAGWLRQEGERGASLAWSRWTIPDEDELDCWIFVTAGPGAHQCYLEIRPQRRKWVIP